MVSGVYILGLFPTFYESIITVDLPYFDALKIIFIFFFTFCIFYFLLFPLLMVTFA